MKFRLTLMALGLLCLLSMHRAHGAEMQTLEDEALSQVTGRDGLAFNLRGFELSGPLSLTYADPNTGSSLWLGNLYLSRSDDVDATFTDPYRLNIYGRQGMADVIELSNPLNVNGLQKWQFAADFGIKGKDGSTFNGGTLILQDLTFYGGGLSITTPADVTVQGVAFGLALKVDIGNLIIRPRERGDISVAKDASVTEQLSISGIKLGGANGGTWALADVTYQPGIFNALTDSNGNSYLHLGIDWNSSPNGAPVGSLSIDNITFKSTDQSGNTTLTNLGSSHIGGIQLQYLDVKFR